MGIIALPNYISDEINKKLDAAFLKAPEAEIDREFYYNELVSFVVNQGFIPDFTITRKDAREQHEENN